ncbi:MAG: hypothetical protein AVDCRST_MAG28-685 [uncultured Rubrobacteraceae bacterium]|uniref:Uncharacterized protein n=1 Tax=uncultured Rubrobacteraceae bacterium TaxID=349277 RepID=A0A6J4QET0_9ACTN|nr:MAG: hypothetical protein AVDCRST_MAG28-685 [uncultured Rubrobacteraceae bacterium]
MTKCAFSWKSVWYDILEVRTGENVVPNEALRVLGGVVVVSFRLG